MKLYCADCMDILKGIPEGSIDMILCDLPYGTTRNKWDVIIPLEPLWAQYRRIIKSNGVIALHSDMPFTAALVSAGKDLYRYELIWVKENGSDFLNANRKPLKAHESIQIFFDILPTAKAGGFLHQPPLRSNRGCCVLQNKGRESPRFQPWDDRPTIMVFFVFANIIVM